MVNWKTVVLNKDILAGDIEGLIGIEELEDYSIETTKTGRKSLTLKRNNELLSKKSKKKNTSNVKETTSKPDQTPAKRLKTKNKTNPNETVNLKNKKPEKNEVEEAEELNIMDDMKSWENFAIDSRILMALHEKRFYEPTEIQRMSLAPSILGKRDLLGAAETGSGKTLAFGIPIVNGILQLEVEDLSDSEEDDEQESDWEDENQDVGCIKVVNISTTKESKSRRLQALILTPTRELAVQVKSHISAICKYTEIKTALIVGGLAQQKQERILKRRPEIVIATPGRLWELLTEGHSHFAEIEKIRYLAIDETDRMLEKGHFEELEKLLEKLNLNEKYKSRRQNFIFSATLTVVHDPPKYLKGKKRKRITVGQKLQSLMSRVGVTNAKVVDLTSQNIVVKTIAEYKIVCTHTEKDYYLYYFLNRHPGRTLVFTNSISCVRRLANLLTLLNCKPLPLHANMEQRQRLKNLEKFTEDENAVLLATDVAARGLDIPGIKHVVHYQVPLTVESYVHRSGRTARANTEGTTLIIVEPKEHKAYLKILHTLGKKKDMNDFPIELSLIGDVKKRVNIAREVDQLSLVTRRKTGERNWFEKTLSEMDMVLDEDELPKKINDTVSINVQKDLKIKRKQLKVLLDKPLLAQNFSGKYPGINRPIQKPGAFVLLKK